MCVIWVGGCRPGITGQMFQKRGECHMTELFIPANHDYIILLRKTPESRGYRMAGAESVVRKLACCEFCIPDISQSITYSHLKAGCHQNVCSSNLVSQNSV